MPEKPGGLSETDLANTAEASLILLLFLAAAALSMFPITRAALHIWLDDPLRSFGCLIPILSLLLILRAWRALGWTSHGSAWGLLPLLGAIVVARISEGAGVTVTLGQFQVDLMQPGPLLFCYFSGVVLLLGGTRLWRSSVFPLCLLVMVNPVPHFFTVWVDLPLQTASANVARSFAHLLGLYPTGEQLQLMFTPKFGMQIVPGCNGMRGAATLAYTALALGYLRRYRPLPLVLIVMAAALLGYLLNFLRLCVLVIYYWAGTHWPRFQANGALVDYIIGGTIFVLVSLLTGALWLGGDKPVQRQESVRAVNWPVALRQRQLAVAAVLLCMLSAIEVPAAYAVLRGRGMTVSAEDALALLPETAGRWKRGETSKEAYMGHVTWVWAKYLRDDGRQVDFGIWLIPSQHYAIISRRMQGNLPTWQGTLDASSHGNVPVRLSTFTLSDDLSRMHEPVPAFFAETSCLANRCSDHFTTVNRSGITAVVGPVAMISTTSPDHGTGPASGGIFRIRHNAA